MPCSKFGTTWEGGQQAHSPAKHALKLTASALVCSPQWFNMLNLGKTPEAMKKLQVGARARLGRAEEAFSQHAAGQRLGPVVAGTRARRTGVHGWH